MVTHPTQKQLSKLEIGTPAPDFTAPDENGSIHRLQDYQGRWVILYFYPKDDTPGCTTESCEFRDHLSAFNQLNAVVFGVSKDSIQSHTKFKNKYNLNFPLLSAEKTTLCDDYGVWVEKSMYGKKYMGIERSTFLIDEQGKIAHIWSKVKIDGHINDVENTLKNLRKNG